MNGIGQLLVSIVFATVSATSALAQTPPGETWRFAVSGDSRNCGDVAMPAIAKRVLQDDVQFYWHLGDFRKLGTTGTAADIDEDIAQLYSGKLSNQEYRELAWGDFVASQIAPFGSLPVYFGIGNHEILKSFEVFRSRAENERRSREEFKKQFLYWLDRPEIRAQRLADSPGSPVLEYYRFERNGVDFISMDNAGREGFDDDQMEWLAAALEKDRRDVAIRAVIVGMHQALPNSLACGHSMNGDLDQPTPLATANGRAAYRRLAEFKRESGKEVYILASHSHFVMENIFDTPYWKNPEHGGTVLPGWIAGTAGAIRYALPATLPQGMFAKTNTYGYLLATVAPDGNVKFEFKEVSESETPEAIVKRYGPEFVHQCFVGNRDPKPRLPPASCNEK